MAPDFCFLYGLSKTAGPRQPAPSCTSCTRLTAQIPRALLEPGAAWGTPSIAAATLPLIEGDCALVVIHFPKQGRVPFKKAWSPLRDKAEAISHTPFCGQVPDCRQSIRNRVGTRRQARQSFRDEHCSGSPKTALQRRLRMVTLQRSERAASKVENQIAGHGKLIVPSTLVVSLLIPGTFET